MSHAKRHSNAWDAPLTDEQRDAVFQKATTGGLSWESVAAWAAETFKIARPKHAAFYGFIAYWRPHYVARRIQERVLMRDVIREQAAGVGDMSPEVAASLEAQAEALVAQGQYDAAKNVFQMAETIRNDLRKKLEATLKRDQLRLARDRVEIQTCEKFLAWFQDAKAREIAESKATNGEKIAALRKAFLADVDAMEASGEVKLPQ
jgi:predicted protein tyrosine phosphatase